MKFALLFRVAAVFAVVFVARIFFAQHVAVRVPASPAAPARKAQNKKPQAAKPATLKPALKPRKEYSRSKGLELGAPTQRRVSRIFKEVTSAVTVDKPAEGHLVYSVFQFTPDRYLPFLSLHDFSAQNAASTYFPFTGPTARSGVVHDPKWSPDGRYVLFKYGHLLEPTDTYWLYVWDTQNNSLQRVVDREISYKLVSWSPDGKYIAYLLNGDRLGSTTEYSSFESYIGPLKLYVCNWRTGQEYLVATSDTLHGPFQWLAPHTLLYDVLPSLDQQTQKNQQNKGKTSPSVPNPPVTPRPQIYTYSIEQKKSTLWMKDGQRAVASPDGQWIAFFGSEDPKSPFPLNEDWRTVSRGDALCIARRDGTGRIALNRETGFYPQIIWLPDNGHLLTLQQTQESPNSEAAIKEWNIKEQTFRLLATLHAKDYEKLQTVDALGNFRPLKIAPSGKEMFVFIFEATGETKMDEMFSQMQNVRTLQRVDLTSGEVATVVRVTNSAGLDYRHEPDTIAK